jgi:hypothetical protein
MSKSLRKHIKVLKQEKNRLYNTVINGGKISKEEAMDYIAHKIFVRNLLQKEKNLLTNRKKSV